MNLSQQRASFSSELVFGSSDLAKILTYPVFSESEYAARLAELKGLGVTAVFAGGRTNIGGTQIAGKGCVGLVVKAKVHEKVYALKIRRTDANRPTMLDEVRYHRIANGVCVGPRLVDYSDNFILMEFAEGLTIEEWTRADIDSGNALAVVKSILEQCYALDRAGIDHGELSHIDRHVIVNDTTATIIDFESASTERKVSNVSAAGQSLLVSGSVASAIIKVLSHNNNNNNNNNKEAAIDVLKNYKHSQTRKNFDAILALL
jgi:putative serine/threonine protein kinase